MFFFKDSDVLGIIRVSYFGEFLSATGKLPLSSYTTNISLVLKCVGRHIHLTQFVFSYKYMYS